MSCFLWITERYWVYNDIIQRKKENPHIEDAGNSEFLNNDSKSLRIVTN